MKPLVVCLSVLVAVAGFSCSGNETPQQEEVVATPPPLPEVDSAQIRFEQQQTLLTEGQTAAEQSISQLQQLSKLLQDSIANTELPAQLQEEFIMAYRNRLHEIGQARNALQNWQQRQQYPLADSLSTTEKVEYVQRELDDLDALLIQARVARREAREAFEEATRAVQPVEEDSAEQIQP